MNFSKITLTIVLSILIQAPALASLKSLPMQVTEVNGVRIAWTETGDPKGVPVILIMGLGSSHHLWGDDFVEGLASAGYRVVLFDNRDVGDSQRFDEHGQPVIWWNLLKRKLGLSVSKAYTLYDMATDTVDLMGTLGIDRAHIVGVSMGGMIAQIVASQYPQHTRSLVSIMSSSGAPHLPPPEPEAQSRLRNMAGAEAEEVSSQHQRGYYPEAMPRQLMAVLDAGDRSAELKAITASALVLHGEDDTLLPIAHGKHTAVLISGASFQAFEGMGHSLPVEVVPKLVESICDHIDGLEQRAAEKNLPEKVSVITR